MEKKILDNIVKFMVLVLPGYLPAMILYSSLVLQKTRFDHPDMIALTLIIIVIIVAAVFLMKGYWWICLPMFILGVCIAMLDDQFLVMLFRVYGICFTLHYFVCGIYVFNHKKG